MHQSQLKNIPSLYLYLGKCLLPRISNILTNQQLYVSAPEHFNDPFDNALGLDLHHGATDKDWVDYFTHLAQVTSPGLPPDEWRKQAEADVNRGLHQTPTFLNESEELMREEAQKLAREVGVLCLSSNPHSVMMWAHYADNHKGLLLRFDTRYLPADQVSGEVRCFPVKYCVSCPSIPEYLAAYKAFNANDLRSVRELFFCRKSRDWKKEKEWRLFTSIPNSFLPFESPLISGVIFGWKMSSSTKDLIKGWTDRYTPKPELLEARPCRNRFRMIITPIKGKV